MRYSMETEQDEFPRDLLRGRENQCELLSAALEPDALVTRRCVTIGRTTVINYVSCVG